MIDKIEDFHKIEAGDIILSIYTDMDDHDIMKIGRVDGTKIYEDEHKDAVTDLFFSENIKDYVFKTKEEMENTFPEYFI
jgi:hypothetical protein